MCILMVYLHCVCMCVCLDMCVCMCVCTARSWWPVSAVCVWYISLSADVCVFMCIRDESSCFLHRVVLTMVMSVCMYVYVCV